MNKLIMPKQFLINLKKYLFRSDWKIISVFLSDWSHDNWFCIRKYYNLKYLNVIIKYGKYFAQNNPALT